MFVLFKDLFYSMCMSTCMHVCAPQKKAWDSLKLEIWMVVLWALRTEPGSSARAAGVLNYWVASPSLRVCFLANYNTVVCSVVGRQRGKLSPPELANLFHFLDSQPPYVNKVSGTLARNRTLTCRFCLTSYRGTLPSYRDTPSNL